MKQVEKIVITTFYTKFTTLFSLELHVKTLKRHLWTF